MKLKPLSVYRLTMRESQMSSDFIHRMNTLMWIEMLNVDQRVVHVWVIQMSVTFELLTCSGNTAA